MPDRYFYLAIASLVALGISLGVLGSRIAASVEPPMPCHEDEALIWVDAPHTAGCVPLDMLWNLE